MLILTSLGKELFENTEVESKGHDSEVSALGGLRQRDCRFGLDVRSAWSIQRDPHLKQKETKQKQTKAKFTKNVFNGLMKMKSLKVKKNHFIF